MNLEILRLEMNCMKELIKQVEGGYPEEFEGAVVYMIASLFMSHPAKKVVVTM